MIFWGPKVNDFLILVMVDGLEPYLERNRVKNAYLLRGRGATLAPRMLSINILHNSIHFRWSSLIHWWKFRNIVRHPCIWQRRWEMDKDWWFATTKIWAFSSDCSMEWSTTVLRLKCLLFWILINKIKTVNDYVKFL